MVQSKKMIVRRRYLHLPVKNGAPMRVMRLHLPGAPVRRFDTELATEDPDFWVFADIGPFAGQSLTVEVEGEDLPPRALDSLVQSDDPPGSDTLYKEEYRPQFHFSSRRGWNNDPNGLIFYRGEYHLFYQHNPYGHKWGNMHWGHAVSPDLVHWTEQPVALYPDDLGTMFSGSGVVDWGDTAGFRSGDEHALVCIYTAAGEPFTQCIAYSVDRGVTWHKYPGNPVLGHVAGRNRDPKVIWHEPTRRWVMALYLEENDYALFTSPDLKAWSHACDVVLPGASECPDLFELPVDGDPGDTRWVFWGANGTYLLGTFDGATFLPQGEAQRYDWGGNSYAAQTWSDIPVEDGRRIQIAWARVDLPGMPFNQFMTFPCELTVRTTPEGLRLFSQPVREIETLRRRTLSWHGERIEPGRDLSPGTVGELLDVQVKFSCEGPAAFGLDLGGTQVVYDAKRAQLTCAGRTAPLRPVDGRVRLRVLVDRASVELFGSDGQTALPLGVLFEGGERPVRAFAEGGSVQLHSLHIHELASIWDR
ncbi:MAG: glycoside hydrolase family 32 protein [Anaerolineae bacterium]|nr:glycoside hydrolase family 32 protein [Anaerolineae bacterium]